MDYLTMPPGEELDRAVAKYVMNYQLGKSNLSASNGNVYYDGWFKFWWEDDYGPTQARWSPSTYIEHAFQVLHKICPKHWWYKLYSNDGLDSGPGVWCEIYRGQKKWVRAMI